MFLSRINIKDVGENEILFESYYQEELDNMAELLIYDGLVIIQGKCRDPSEFIKDQIVMEAENCHVISKTKMGWNLDKVTYYLHILCDMTWKSRDETKD